MLKSPINTEENKLKAGTTEKAVSEAIRLSGYPLQIVVGNTLRGEFRCQDEWSYIDSDSGEQRTIDIRADKHLYELGSDITVRPILSLLVECKQSDLPYIFFLSPDRLSTNHYPLISGLFRKSISIKTDDTRSTWSLAITNLMEADKLPFLSDPVPSCLTFSKCVRKGKDLELSGTDGFQNIVQPLAKALKHFDATEIPPKTAQYFDCHLGFALAIVDAPMIGVTVAGNDHELELIPWVRVFRHESLEADDWWDRTRIVAIDIVHKSFLKKFLQNHLLPFANSMSERLIRNQGAIASGKGFIKGMEANSWNDLEARLIK